MLRPILALAKVRRTSKADVVDQLAKALQRVPRGPEFGRALDEVRGRAERIAAEGAREREGTLKRLVGELVRSRKAAGEEVREVASGWRIGRFELELDEGQPRARVLYNKEVVAPWAVVTAGGDLDALFSGADKKLESAELPTASLAEVFSRAFQAAERGSGTLPDAGRVPLRDFYRAVRVELVRDELHRAAHPDAKLELADFPKWAFLYNVDRYRAAPPDMARGRRLVLETGSQQDHRRGLSMVLNGLKASQDYRSYCYVRSQG